MRDPSFHSRFVVVMNNEICTQIYKRVFDAVTGVEYEPTLLCSGQYATNFYVVLQQMCDEHAQTQQIVLGQQHKIDRVIKRHDRDMKLMHCDLARLNEQVFQLELERAAAWTDLPEAEPDMFTEDLTDIEIERLQHRRTQEALDQLSKDFPDNALDSFRPEGEGRHGR